MMQTALADDSNLSDETTNRIRLLLNFGKENGTNHLPIYTFSATKAKDLETPIVKIGIMLKLGFVVKLQANVAPEAIGKIERQPIEFENIKAVPELKLQTLYIFLDQKSDGF